MIYGVGEITLDSNTYCCSNLSISNNFDHASRVCTTAAGTFIAYNDTAVITRAAHEIYATFIENDSNLLDLRIGLATPNDGIAPVASLSSVFYSTTNVPFPISANIVYIGESSLDIGEYTLVFSIVN
jgi:hypothetical protein